MRRRTVVRLRLLVTLAAVSLVAVVAMAMDGATHATAQSESLALVYFERGVIRPGNQSSAVVWAMALDGSSKHEVARFGMGAFPLGLQGSMVAMYERNDLTFVDVASGRVRTVDAGGWPYVGRFVSGGPEAGSFVYSTQMLCTRHGQTLVGKIDPESGTRTEIATMEDAVVEVAWHDPATGDVLTLPRTCNPGTWELRRLDGASGAVKSSMPVKGCGWFRVAPDGQQALASFSDCRDDLFPELTVYGLSDGSSRDIRFGEDRPNDHPFVYASDGRHAAFGLSLTPETRGRQTKSGGIWLLDTTTLKQTKLWQDARGMETWPIDWSPDGSKLLVASMESQDYCSFSVLDVASGEASLVNGIKRCRLDGTMVGFATVPS